MSRALPVLLCFSSLSLMACGAEDPPATDPYTLHMETGAYSVSAGESFTCIYTDTMTTKELSVLSASAVQGPGSHHLTLYYVDNKRPAGIAPCSGTAEMADWHFVVGAGGQGATEGLIDLAEGLAVKIPAGKQLMIQTHYINTSGAELQTADTLDVKLVEPSQVKAYVGDFVVLDDTFELPAHSPHESISECVVQQETKLTMILGHMHEHGVHYKLDKVDDQGNLMETLYEYDWIASYASHPPLHKFTMENPLVFPAGTRLRQTCSWNNTSADALLFPTEMCIAFGYYFPGESRIMCERIMP